MAVCEKERTGVQRAGRADVARKPVGAAVRDDERRAVVHDQPRVFRAVLKRDRAARVHGDVLRHGTLSDHKRTALGDRHAFGRSLNLEFAVDGYGACGAARQQHGFACDGRSVQDAGDFRIADRGAGEQRVRRGRNGDVTAGDVDGAFVFVEFEGFGEREVLVFRVPDREDQAGLLFAPCRQVARRVVGRDLEIVRAVRDLVERERIGRHVGFRHVPVSGRVTDRITRDALIVPGFFPRNDRAGRLPFAGDDLDLIRGLGVDRTERICGGNVAVHGRPAVALDHEVERIIAAREIVRHDPFPAAFGRGVLDHREPLAGISGVLSRAVDGQLNIRQAGQVAELIADRSASAGVPGRDRDDRLPHAALDAVDAERRVLVVVGVHGPLAGPGVVHGDGDEILAAEFAHDLHVFISPGRDRFLRVFHPVAGQRNAGGAAAQIELEQAHPGITDGDGFAG